MVGTQKPKTHPGSLGSVEKIYLGLLSHDFGIVEGYIDRPNTPVILWLLHRLLKVFDHGYVDLVVGDLGYI